MTLQQQDFQGTKDAYIFDVKTSRYVKVNSMNYARWYPTLAEMGNGMVMAMSGLNGAGQVTMNSEMFNPDDQARGPQGPIHGFPTYPATFLTENGQLFFTGSNSGYGPSTPAWRTPGILEREDERLPPGAGHPGPARTWRPAPRSCCRQPRSRRSWSWAAAASASQIRPPPARR